MAILDYFLLNEPQLTTALYTSLYIILSGIIGVALRRRWVEGAAWGFMILAGSANLGIFISRAIALSTTAFGPLVVMLCAITIFVLRTFFLNEVQAKGPLKRVYIGVLISFIAIIWCGNILNPNPDSGFSSHHGWVPLYVQESFSFGRFLTIDDMAFGEGLMTTLFYPVDLLGLVALAGWAGFSEVYPAFNGSSIAASMIMFALLSRTVKDDAAALILFFALSILMFALDPFFRTVLGGNWGDVLIYLGGALVCYYLAHRRNITQSLLLASIASVFLVFGRHYGAFYSAVIISFCFSISWIILKERSLKPWFVIGAVWTVFSLREVYFLVGNLTKYYPGSWQAERLPWSGVELFLGTLTDWGIIDGSNLSLSGLSVRSLYIATLIFVLWSLRHKSKRRQFQIIEIVAPLLLLLSPFLLQTLTGFRTNEQYSKLYILGIFMFAWYPPYLLSQLNSSQNANINLRKFGIPIFAASSIGLLIVGLNFIEKSERVRIFGNNLQETLDLAFEDKIVDREVVIALKEELSTGEMNDVVDRPVMYLYFEPGTSLRLYLGGSFFKDLDFWSERVGLLSEGAESFSEILEILEYPNIYIGLMSHEKVPDFGLGIQRKFIPEIENFKTAAWLEKFVQVGDATFLIVRDPDR